ncbi:MAG: hypothetical protein VB021_07125 [Oscillospiraceae bacterium]|nr:hypothetical protein [Oscillospiraceae bacterium]
MDAQRAVILLYAAGLLAAGAGFARRERGGHAGRRAAPSLFAAVMSLCAGFIGGGFSLGNAQAGFCAGIGNAAALCGFSAGQLLVALFAAGRLARFPGARTAGDLMAAAFGPTAKRFTGLLSVLFCTGVLGAQIGAFGAVAGYVFGADARLCAAAGFAAVILYTALGGPRAALRSDAIQVPALLLCTSAALAVLLARAGGAARLYAGLPPSFSRLFPAGRALPFLSLFFTFMLGEMLCPPAVSRLMRAAGDRARTAGALSAALSVPFFFVSSMLGTAARVLGAARTPQQALPAALSAALPFPLGALALGAMLCVYLSSGGAFLSACAAALALDVFSGSGGGRAQARALRLACFACGGAALALALAFDGVLSILIVAYCFWCPVMLVPLLFALGGRSAPERLFFASAGAAAAALLAWRALGEPFGVSPLLAGLLASAAVFAAALPNLRKKDMEK